LEDFFITIILKKKKLSSENLHTDISARLRMLFLLLD